MRETVFRRGIGDPPLRVHSEELHHKNIPEKLYKAFDLIRQTVSGYRPGIRRCTHRRKSTNHLFKSEATYNRPKKVSGSLRIDDFRTTTPLDCVT